MSDHYDRYNGIEKLLSTNLAEVGTDCISRQSAIDALRKMQTYKMFSGDDMLLIDQAGAQTELMLLPPIQPVNNSENPNSSEAISRQAAIEKILGQPPEPHYPSWYAAQIKELPSARPKNGRWIEYEQEFMLEEPFKTVQKTVKECSVCTTKIAGMVGIMNFCPNCGADMREEVKI